MHVGLVTDIRRKAFELLQKTPFIGGFPVEVYAIEGHRHFTLSAQDTWKKYRETYFCPVLQGDLPYQKRFFDVALSGCLPVVVAFPSSGNNSHHSWFSAGSLGYNDTYPFASSINYSEFVVQLERVDDMVPTLESLLNDKAKIQKMQAALGSEARKFVYGLGDDFMQHGDAFDTLLRELEHYVHRFA